jgi:hypothetical protein
VTERAIVLPASATPAPAVAAPETAQRPPYEAIVAAVVIAALLLYALLYGLGLNATQRYQAGFVVKVCPVCGRGQLSAETRTERFLGIPIARYTVRCNVCRSVLRETRRGRWRYAVDPLENPALYERWNGREITEADLVQMATGVAAQGDDPTRDKT